MPNYNIIASSLPVPTGPTSYPQLGDCSSVGAASPVLEGVARGETGDAVPTKINTVLTEVEVLGAGAGKGFGVLAGLTAGTPAGLVVPVDAGQAVIFGVVEVPATEVTLPPSTARVYVWLKLNSDRTTAITKATTTAAPQERAVLLWTAATDSSGVISGSIDYSGVVDLSGGIALRRTADLGMPGDAPSSHTRFLTRTLYGTWLWDGLGYRLQPTGPTLYDFAADANATLTQAVYEGSLIRVTDSGTVLTTGRDVVVPAVTTPAFAVVNDTAQTLTLKVAGQTGQTLAAGKTALFRGNGTDVKLVSAAVTH